MFTAAAAHLTNLASTVVAAGIFDWADSKTSQASSTLQKVLILVGLLVAVTIAWRGKTIGSAIIGICVGGLIAAIPTLIEWFGGSVSDETNNSAPYTGGLVGQHIEYAKAALIAYKA